MRLVPHSTSFFVNLLARVCSPLYSIEKRSSQGQLREDFGEFPPAPLRCESLRGEFSVIRASGLGRIYCDLAVQMRALDADIGSLSTDLVSKFGADRLRDLQSTFARLGPRRSKYVKRVVFGWLFVVTAAKALRYETKRSGGLGLFVPFFKDEFQIVVSSRRHLHKLDAPIISHEHIHLLQHTNPECHSRNVRAPQELLSEEGRADPFLLYTLEKIEVEARLHEVVLSFYRAHHHLPTTVSAFLGLLASGEIIGSFVTNILMSGGVSFHQETEKYPQREVGPVEHLGGILVEIKTPELRRRFITEVLSVMYGNLLKYYGDDGVSRSFLSDISRPNFYDELYAA